MRIVDLLSQDKIALGAVAADKEAAIDLLVEAAGQERAASPTRRPTKKPFWPVRPRAAPPLRRASPCPTPRATV